MKMLEALVFILTFSLLITLMFVVKPASAASGIYFTANPVAISPLTDSDPNLQTLETPSTPSSAGGFFDVEIHLTGATLAHLLSGVEGVEVHFDFSSIMSYAVPIGYTDELGQTGGVLTGPQNSLLYGIAANFFNSTGGKVTNPLLYETAEEYDVAAAATNGNWNGADGLVAVIHFKITNQPSGVQPPLIGSLTLTTASAVDGSANPIVLDSPLQGTLHIDPSPFNYPPRPGVYITPAVQHGGTTLGATFNYTVMLNSAGFWDIAEFDVQVTWNNTLINLVAYSEGNFLHQFGDPTFGFWNVLPGSIEAAFAKLANSGASGGIDSILQLEFNVTYVGNSYPPPNFSLHIAYIDLVLWAHPSNPLPPWYDFILPVDVFPFPGVTVTDATYVAGYVNPGPNVDLYDQYPTPYGGQGPNVHSDSFAPQQLVCLYSEVTYGGDRVTNKLVSFEIHDALGDKITLLQNYSDSNGIASVCFRIPQTDLIPGGEDPSIFGWWTAIATVELDQVTVNDTMAFQVGWFAQVVSVTANNAPYLKYTDQMNFSAVFVTMHEQPISLFVSIDSYDSQGCPMGETAFLVIVNATRVEVNGAGGTTGGIYSFTISMQTIPTWARVGTASVVGYALTDFPRNGGTPWGPQSPATLFAIKLS